jgi:hypothetical protein
MIQAAAYDVLILALNSQAFKHFAQLLGISAEEAQPIISTYAACDDFYRDMVRARLKHLFENASVAQMHSFLKLKCNFKTSLDS